MIKLAVALAVIAAFAVGGATLASGGSKPAHKSPAAKVQVKVNRVKVNKAKPSQAAKPASKSQDQPSPGDTDNLQEGDQTTPDTPGAAATQEAAAEAPGTETESASETGPSDGPGGYADTNPNADTQQEGEH